MDLLKKGKMPRWSPILLFLFFSAACDTRHAPDATALSGALVMENTHARYFQILGDRTERWLIVFGPAGRTDTLGIYHFGTNGNVLATVAGVDRAIVASTTHLSFIAALGQEEKVVGATHLDQVFNERIKELAAAGKIKEVGVADGLDQEALVQAHAQIILDHAFGRVDHGSRIGVPVVRITEYLEEHPLGRAEWIKVFGLLFGAEEQSQQLFERIRAAYERTALNNIDVEHRPKVFFGSAWQGQWFAPPANSYMATLIQDAGGEYVFADSTGEGNITLDLETVIHKVRRADHFGMILAADRVDAAVLAGGDHRLMRLKAVNEGGFYGSTRTSDLFGQALLEPHVLLEDLAMIFHGTPEGGREPRYFLPVAGDLAR